MKKPFFLFLNIVFCFFLQTPGFASSTKRLTSIRAVDFKNFTYGEQCITGVKTLPVKNGVYQQGSIDESKRNDYVDFEITKVIYGDITGDGQDDAIVLTFCNTGGTGEFTDGLVYSLEKSALKFLGTLGVGDRANGGIYDVRIKNGNLEIDRFGQEESGACCPEYISTESFKLKSNKFVPVGTASKHPFQNADVDYRYPKK